MTLVSKKKAFVLSQILRKSVGVFLVYFLSREYSKTDFGKISLFFIVGVIATMLLDFGMSDTTTRELSKKTNSPSFFLNRSFEIRIIFIIFILLTYLLGIFCNFWQLSIWPLLVVIWSISDSTLLTYLAVYRSQLNFVPETAISTIKTGLIVAVSTILAVNKQPILHIGLSLATINLAALIVVMTINRSRYQLDEIYRLKIIRDRKFLKLPLSFFIIALSYHLAIRIDSLMVKLLTSYESLSVFEVASLMTRNAVIIPHAISLIFFPMIAASTKSIKPTSIRTLIKKQLNLITPIAMALIAIQLIWGDKLLLMIFSKKYISSVEIMYIYAASTPALFANLIFINALSAAGKNKQATIIYCTMITSTIIMNFLLLPTLGLKGASISAIASGIIALIPALIFTTRLLKNHAKDKAFFILNKTLNENN